ncbi:ricin-type beta-trefoil lectin domain protein [Streptomyces sp. NPDC089424]|uniref:ricin-type beta-trefoil lectin domain protein n=1 Tax=Streptomyces sp. NPDC089424 TaxID=3365917 RepID=UPI00382B9252
MQPPYPPPPPYPPWPGPRPAESDRELLARCAGPEPDARAAALLLARHWRAVHAYAVICLAASTATASMAATAAFQQVLGRRTAAGALRPQLLTGVRDTVREWAAEDDVRALLPELGTSGGGRGPRAGETVTPERRRLAERAFHALPSASQCLLWHTEVEADAITVPAGLLGIDALGASSGLARAHEEFRAGCVRAHRELAPTRECRFYNRLLDVPMRRGGALLPDVQRHLTRCGYCRHAADQLGHFDGALGVLLAETVLGRGARRYLDSRPGRAPAPPPPPRAPALARPPVAARSGAGGRHRPPRTGLVTVARRHARAVAVVGVCLTSLALLATVLAARGRSDGHGAPEPGATWGAPSVRTVPPGSASREPSAASRERPVEVARGRLRSLADGRCLDGREGAALLRPCSTAGSQQWSYLEDGRLRGVAAPSRCLDADADADADADVVAAVTLSDCDAPSGQVRYDLTVRGELLLRRGNGRLVAPGAGGELAVVPRDGSTEQRWRVEVLGERRRGSDVPRSADGRGWDGRKGRPDQRRGDPHRDGDLDVDRSTGGGGRSGEEGSRHDGIPRGDHRDGTPRDDHQDARGDRRNGRPRGDRPGGDTPGLRPRS